MAFWDADLTTEDGALGAAQLGSYACFVAAVLSVLGALLIGGALAGSSAPVAAYFAIGAGLEALLFAIAGFRLRAGRGAIWGIVSAVVIALELLGKLAALNIVGIGINAVLLIGMINGVRGALAIRRASFDSEDAAAIFE